MTEQPGRPWWRKKRWAAAAVLTAVLGYPASFVPAGWLLLRLDPRTDGAAWGVVRFCYLPAGRLAAACPADVRDAVAAAVNLGRTERSAFVLSGGRGGVVRRETDGGRDTTVIYSVW